MLKNASIDSRIALPVGLPTAQVHEPAEPRGRDHNVTEEEIMKSMANNRIRRVANYCNAGNLCGNASQRVGLAGLGRY